MRLDRSKQVEPVRTRWGEPWHHAELVLRMDALLKACGIENAAQRVKMIAHAIFASGWKQNVWHYNAWGVKIGTWQGPWYTMGTDEADDQGTYYSTRAAWRAFSSWCAAVEDYLQRIAPNSWNASYRQAWSLIQVPGIEAERSFWAALGSGGYYTDKVFGPEQFGSLCARVRRELSTANEADRIDAADWANTSATKPRKEGPGQGFSFWAIVAVAAFGVLGAFILWKWRSE